MMTTEDMIMQAQLVERGGATSEEINLAFNVACAGWDVVLHKILYVRTGYRSIEQMINEEDD